MDTVALTYYALICALLSMFSPHVGGALRRLVIGAVVGIAAAASLPVVRGALGVI